MSQLGLFRGVVRDALGFMNSAVGTDFSRSNMPRVGLTDSAGDTNHVALATGVMTSVPITLAQGDVVTNISVRSGNTAAGTPTAYWLALYSNASTPALLAQTADQTTTAWAANTTKTLALSAPVTITQSGVYWVGIMVTATTPPSLIGTGTAAPIVTGERNLSQSSGSSLTTTAPSTITSASVKVFAPYVVVT